MIRSTVRTVAAVAAMTAITGGVAAPSVAEPNSPPPPRSVATASANVLPDPDNTGANRPTITNPSATVAEQLRKAGFKPASFEQHMRIVDSQNLEELTGIDGPTPDRTTKDGDAIQGASAQIGPCNPRTRMDDIGVRRGQVRVHGWWLKNDCDNSKARVTVKLQQLWWNGRYGTWITRDTGSRVLKPGTSTRTTASRYCDSSAITGWRAVADVDVVDEWDAGDRKYQRKNLPCRDY